MLLGALGACLTYMIAVSRLSGNPFRLVCHWCLSPLFLLGSAYEPLIEPLHMHNFSSDVFFGFAGQWMDTGATRN